MNQLALTSCLFATIPIHAFHAHNTEYHHLFLLVTVLSVLFHSTQHPVIRHLDTAVAHTAFIFMIKETQGNPGLLMFPLAVAVLWVLQIGARRETQDALHAWLHVVSVMGVHVFLIAKGHVHAEKNGCNFFKH